MFTGIIESLGVVKNIIKEGENFHISIESDFTNELKVDQSVAHDGVCLTIVKIEGDIYTVTAIKETLDKSNLRYIKVNDVINLERAMILGARLDGHIVQGHVDQTATCTKVEEADGSWYYTFEYDFDLEAAQKGYMTVEKGSVTVNGVSLTVVNSKDNSFQVAIIPFTQEVTNFHTFGVGSVINIEFDIIGKYLSKLNSYKQ